MSAHTVLIMALTLLAFLPQGAMECSIERVPHTSGDDSLLPSWAIKDSKGCGYNRGVDPVYVMKEWYDCIQAGGYAPTSNECNVVDRTPGGEDD